MTIFRFLNPRSAPGLFLVASLILVTGLYVVYDNYLDSVGREIAGGWLQSEAVAIQEGNLLSSISKNQRVLLSSQFIKGIQLVDTTRNRPLIEIGEDYDQSTPENLQSGLLKSVGVGFLHRQVFYRLPEQPELVLSFQIHSMFLIRAFSATVTVFSALLVFLFTSIRRVESKRIEAENKNRILLGEVAARVAHDIRSPLSTLNAVLETIEGLPPNSRKLLTTAILRIREIGLGIADHTRLAMAESSSLKEIYISDSDFTEATLVAPLIEEGVDEKRVQYPGRSADLNLKVAADAHAKFAVINTAELRRSLSNLIDNAIQASNPGSQIDVTLETKDQLIQIEIVDRGVGMPKQTLARVGTKGFTKDKADGTGIGVYYAKRAILSWNGSLRFESEVGKGTRARIELPIAESPSWIMGDMQFAGYSTIVVVDDDPTIHSLWIELVAKVGLDITVEHFFDPASATSWALQNRTILSRCLLLTDFNLNSWDGTGLTVLEGFGLNYPSAVMVTNAFNDRALRTRCERMNVKIMPKSMITAAFQQRS